MSARAAWTTVIAALERQLELLADEEPDFEMVMLAGAAVDTALAGLPAPDLAVAEHPDAGADLLALARQAQELRLAASLRLDVLREALTRARAADERAAASARAYAKQPTPIDDPRFLDRHS